MFKTEEKNLNFVRIYDEYAEKIYNFIYYRTSHKETVEDLASETFLKALKNFDSFDENKGSLKTWLYRIARNTVIDFYRTRKKNINLEEVWNLSDERIDLILDFDEKERLKKVKKYLKKLTADQREVVVLRIWEDMSYKEISEILNKSESNCRMAFSRAVKSLVAFLN